MKAPETCATETCGNPPEEGRAYCRDCAPRWSSPAGEDGFTDVQKQIISECDAVKYLLLQKNKEYGNSALEPIGVFSTADPVRQIEVRIDDKLKRLQNPRRMRKDGEDVQIHEDTEQDLIGYLVLLRVARKFAKK